MNGSPQVGALSTNDSTLPSSFTSRVGVLVTSVGPYYVKAIKNIESLLGGVKFIDKIFKLVQAILDPIAKYAHSVTARADARGLGEWVKDARFMMSIPGVFSGISKIKSLVSEAAVFFSAMGTDKNVVILGKDKKGLDAKIYHGNLQKAMGGFAKLAHWFANAGFIGAFGFSRPCNLAEKISKEYHAGAKISESARSIGSAFSGFIMLNHVGSLLACTAENLREGVAYMTGTGEYNSDHVAVRMETSEQKAAEALFSKFLSAMVMAIAEFIKHCADLTVDFLNLLKVTTQAAAGTIVALNLYIASMDLVKIFVDQTWTPDAPNQAAVTLKEQLAVED